MNSTPTIFFSPRPAASLATRWARPLQVKAARRCDRPHGSRRLWAWSEYDVAGRAGDGNCRRRRWRCVGTCGHAEENSTSNKDSKTSADARPGQARHRSDRHAACGPASRRGAGVDRGRCAWHLYREAVLSYSGRSGRNRGSMRTDWAPSSPSPIAIVTIRCWAGIERLVKDGAIGRVVEIRARGKEDARGGSLDLYVLGSHLLNLINYFGGKPLSFGNRVAEWQADLSKPTSQEGAEGIGPFGRQRSSRPL